MVQLAIYRFQTGYGRKSIGAGRGGEPKPLFEIRKLLISQSPKSLKSPEPTFSGTNWAQTGGVNSSVETI